MKQLETFSILTIGDGLVSQIPALLISTAAGIIVTRAASEGNLAHDITTQLFAYPKLLYIVAGTLICTWHYSHRFIGITTFPIAGLLIYAALKMQKNLEREALEEEQLVEEQQIEEVRSPESVIILIAS